MNHSPAPHRLSARASKTASLLQLLVMTLLCACSVDELEELSDDASENSCEDNGDCGSGSCDSRFDACVSARGDLEGVLLQIAPPASVRGYGGLLFFQELRDLQRSSRDLEVVVAAPTQVIGQLVATDPLALQSCAGSGETTLPAKVTFTPAQDVLGLNVVAYQTTTALSDGEQVFEMSLPAGEYDIYIEPSPELDPDSGAPSPDCVLVPQLSRGVQVSGARVELTLNQLAPQPLQVSIVSQARFDGWGVDLIHPVTGQVLSTRDTTTLYQPVDGPVEYRANIHYSVVTGLDYVPLGQELVRLTPPQDLIAPVVLMSRAGLEIFTPGQAIIEQLEPFGALIDFEGWVLQKGDENVPVPGSVTFSATDLQGVAPGVFASFEVNAEVEADGQVRAQLLAGDYRVRVMPAVGSPYAASETSVTVLPAANSEAPQAVQAGQVIEVPLAVDLRGRVGLPGSIESLVGSEVFAEPTALRSYCTVAPAQDDGAMADQLACSQRVDPILRKALAEDPFVPRHAVGMVNEGARFAIEDVDCGACEAGNGALFDVSLRPPQLSRLPWLVKAAVSVEDDLDLGLLPLGYPIIHQGQLRVADAGCEVASEACVLPGALVSAFVVLDDRGQVIPDPANVPRCTLPASDPPSAERCARATLKVAEARASDSGNFELLLPATLD